LLYRILDGIWYKRLCQDIFDRIQINSEGDNVI